MNWYFSRNYHHFHYPHLSNRYITHYERHRSSSSSSTWQIRQWMNQNRNTYGDWLRDDDRRVERLRNFGYSDQANRKDTDPVYTRPRTTIPKRPIRPQSREIERRSPIINRPTEYHREIQRKTKDRLNRSSSLPSSARQLPQIQRKPGTVKRRRN